MTDVELVVRSLRGGKLAVLPTDTVYGLTCIASDEEAAADLYRLKGRDAIQPTAVIFSSVASLLDRLPELDESTAAIAQALLPGPYTLVVPDRAGRFQWLAVGRPGTIGIRVPLLPRPTDEIVGRVGAVAATSANLPGGRDPRLLDDVPREIREGVEAVVDGGALPGTPSTVVDLTGVDPVVLRDGAADPEATLARIAAAHTQSLPPADEALTREA